MAKANTRTPKQAPAAQAPAQAPAAPAAAPAPSALPTPATATLQAPQAAPATVALRGGTAVAQVALSGKAYRTAAPHNVAWWNAITKAVAAGPEVQLPGKDGTTVPGHAGAVAAMLATPSNPGGVPAHFVAYCLRRGYLQAV